MGKGRRSDGLRAFYLQPRRVGKEGGRYCESQVSRGSESGCGEGDRRGGNSRASAEERNDGCVQRLGILRTAASAECGRHVPILNREIATRRHKFCAFLWLFFLVVRTNTSKRTA